MAIFPESRNGGIYHHAPESSKTGKGVSVGECGSGIRDQGGEPGTRAPGRGGGGTPDKFLVLLSEQEVALQAPE